MRASTLAALAAAAASAASAAFGVAPADAARASPTPLPAAVIAARAEAALLGSFVSDAAVMPLHWIYDTNEIKQLVG